MHGQNHIKFAVYVLNTLGKSIIYSTFCRLFSGWAQM